MASFVSKHTICFECRQPLIAGRVFLQDIGEKFAIFHFAPGTNCYDLYQKKLRTPFSCPNCNDAEPNKLLGDGSCYLCLGAGWLEKKPKKLTIVKWKLRTDADGDGIDDED